METIIDQTKAQLLESYRSRGKDDPFKEARKIGNSRGSVPATQVMSLTEGTESVDGRASHNNYRDGAENQQD